MTNPFDELVEHYIYRGVERPVTARAYDYVLAGNGLFKRADGRHVWACMPVADVFVAGLPEVEREVLLLAGRIQGRLLRPILEDARRKAVRGEEAMYQVRLVDGMRWRVAVPEQRASGGRVQYVVRDDEDVICDVHSHHEMRARFSGTDDSDEGGFRFYAVVGRVLTRPEIRVRLGMYGDFWEMPATTLFTDPGPFMDCLSEER